MRTNVNRVAVSLFMSAVLASPLASAETITLPRGQTIDDALADARRSLEIANLELRLYRQVEFPRKQRQLSSEIQLVSAEIRALQHRVREYKGFHRSRYSAPFLVSLQIAELALLDAELHLKDLRAEQNAHRRFHADHARLFELKAAAARSRVVRLDRLRNGP